MNIVLLSSFILFITINSCFITSSAQSVAPENEAALRAVSTGLNQFTADFYKTALKNNDDNVICSPLSVGIVLAMTSFGARGITQTQMRTALRLPDDDTTKIGHQTLIDTLNSMRKVTLNLAQNIFVSANVEVKPEFKDIMENYFRSEYTGVDFSNSEEASKIINNWCEQKTNNRITDIVKPSDLEHVVMVLANAVYFKGKWIHKFKGINTLRRPFHVDESTTKDVETMYQEDAFNYGSLPELNAVYVELPYESAGANDSISMFVILPNEVNGLKNTINNFDKVNFQQLHNDGQMTNMRLFMPKFKTETTLDLKPVLERMGMVNMFYDNADFTGITDVSKIKINKVIQKAFIEVNEEGSEAAAVTAVIAVPMSMPMPPPNQITVEINRPFMCAIHHRATNTVLFLSKIQLPSMQ